MRLVLKALVLGVIAATLPVACIWESPALEEGDAVVAVVAETEVAHKSIPEKASYQGFRWHLFRSILNGEKEIPRIEDVRSEFGEDFVKSVYTPVASEIGEMLHAIPHRIDGGVLLGMGRSDLEVLYGLLHDKNRDQYYLVVVGDPSVAAYVSIVFDPALQFSRYSRSVDDKAFSGQIYQAWGIEQEMLGNMLSGVDIAAATAVVLKLSSKEIL